MDMENNGLYEKFFVVKRVDGTTITDCFVLVPEKDPAAVVAMQAYAAATPNKALADDLYRWVGKPLKKPLTLYEVRTSAAVWLEDKDKDECISALVSRDIDRNLVFQCRHYKVIGMADEYGIRWRAWDHCPTEEERAAAPWVDCI